MNDSMYKLHNLTLSNNIKNPPHLLVFDMRPVLNKYFTFVQEALTLVIKGDDTILANLSILTLDTIKEIVADVFSCYENDNAAWQQAINRSEIYPDILSYSEQFPNSKLNADNSEIAQNTMQAYLRNIENNIFNDLVWWFTEICPVPRSQVVSVVTTHITVNSITCCVYYE